LWLNQNDDEEELDNELSDQMNISKRFDHEEYIQKNLNINYLMNWLVKKTYRINDDRQINDHQVINPIDFDKE
jgi:hypothetical protein